MIPLTFRPMLTNSRRIPLVNLGQAWPGTTPAPTGTPGLEWYKCGIQPPRQMTAQMAAMVPGGCQRVEAPTTSPVPTPTTGGFQTGGTGGLLQDSPAWQGPTVINLLVVEPQELGPFPGAKVSIDLIDWIHSQSAQNPVVVQTAVTTGFTDAQGKWSWTGQAPTPNRNYRWRIRVEPGPSTPNFSPTVLHIPARTPVGAAKGNSAPEIMTPVAVACPSGTNSLVCAVAQAQVEFSQIYEQQLVAWGAGATAIAMDMAHSNVPMEHPELKKHHSPFSWWVADLSIKPRQWPTLVKNYDQMLAIFQAIPFPRPNNTDLFIRCARGIPVWKGMSMWNAALFISDYFPREDRKIRADLAYCYVVNLSAIVLCMQRRLEAKARELQRQGRTLKIIALCTSMMLAPLAGLAGLTTVLTDAAMFAYEAVTEKPIDQGEQTLVTAGVAVASADPAALEKLLSAGLTLILQKNGEGLDPILQQVIMTGVPKLASAAVGDSVAGILGTGASSGALDFVSLQGLGSAAAAVAIKMLSNMIIASGARDVKSFKRLLLAMEDLPAEIIPFVTWAINQLLLDKLFELAAQDAGLSIADGVLPPEVLPPGVAPGTMPVPVQNVPLPVAPTPGPGDDEPLTNLNMQEDFIDPLVNRAEAEGVDVPSSAQRPASPVISPAPDILPIAGGVGVVGLLALIASGVFGK